MRNFICLLVMSLFVLSGANAQKRYKGRVVDEAGHSIQDVNVVIYQENSLIVNSVFTDEDGCFDIVCLKDVKPAFIGFVMMGYETRQMRVDEFIDNQTFTLKSKVFALKEVNVRPDKITQNNDTLVYHVLSFKQSQDRSIADVIAKMPGLEVQPDGRISFEGSPIIKFYIEGMDLMGGKYAQASENLNADMISSVQVIQNHQPIKSLRGVQFSDRAALNIVLKENVKNAWAGTLDAGAGRVIQGGGESLYTGKLMGMVFGRKQQNLSLYKGDNTGKDIAKETVDLTERIRDRQEEEGLLKALVLPAPDIDNQRLTFNDSHLIATNHLLKTKRDNDVRIQLDFLRDKKDAFSSQISEYLDMDGVVLTEENDVSSENRRLKGDVTYKVNKKDIYLNNRIHGNFDFNTGFGNTVLESGSTKQNVRIKKSHVTEDFEMINRLNNGNSIRFSSQNTYSYLPGRLLTIADVTEKLNISAFQSHNYTSFSHRVGGLTLNHSVGLKLKMQQMDVDYQELKEKEKYAQQNFYASSSLNIERKTIKLRAIVKAEVTHRSYREKEAVRMTLQPYLNLQYEPNGTTTTSVNYSYNERTDDLMDIFRTPIFTSYRTLNSHTGNLNDKGTHTASIFWKYKQPVKGDFLNMMFSWTRRVNEILYRSSYESSLYHRMPTELSYDADTYVLGGSAAHSFYWGKTMLSLNVQQMWSSYYLLQKETKTPWQMRNTEATFKMSMQPFNVFSCELSNRVHVNKQINKSNKVLSAGTLVSFRHSVSLNFFPLKKLELGMKSDLYHTSDDSMSESLFMDAHVSYQFRHCEFRLNCDNVFGTHLYERRIRTSSTNVYSAYQLRPREIMLCCSLDF